jgi:ABC-type transport system involved in multi-copper enzyme maturation permease subunit
MLGTRFIRNEWILFWGISRRLFTLQAGPVVLILLLLPLATLWIGVPSHSTVWMQCLGLTLGVGFLLSMNLLPQEIEDGTLEVTFTLPSSRNRHIMRQMAVVWFWNLLFYSALATLYYGLAECPTMPLTMSILPATIFFTTLTVWISAVIRNGPLAGLLAALAAFIHFRYLPQIGFLKLFVNPFAEVTDTVGRTIASEEVQSGVKGQNSAIIWSLLLTWLFVELLLRRMRKSELWMR